MEDAQGVDIGHAARHLTSGRKHACHIHVTQVLQVHHRNIISQQSSDQQVLGSGVTSESRELPVTGYCKFLSDTRQLKKISKAVLQRAMAFCGARHPEFF